MFFTLYSFINNSIYFLRTPYNLMYKVRMMIMYVCYTFLRIIPLIPKPRSIGVFKYNLKGFDYNTIYYLFGEIFIKNEYYFKTKKKNPIIFDCGSNIGGSVLFFKNLYPESTIFAFEPDPQTFELLKENVKNNNLKNVKLFNAALSNKKGKLTFYTDENPGNLMMSALKSRMSKRSISVDTVSLADYVNNESIDFMKMDIEGFETNVMLDLHKKKKLSKIKELIFEFHHNIPGENLELTKILDILLDEGYKLQLDTSIIPIYSKDKFQDILIFAYK